jgi:hypothetical protein
VVTVQVVVIGCAESIGSLLIDSGQSNNHAAVGIDSSEDGYPQAIREGNSVRDVDRAFSRRSHDA